jgi:hypothetical protein
MAGYPELRAGKGVAGSLGLMFRAGHRQNYANPAATFHDLGVFSVHRQSRRDVVSKRGSILTRSTLYSVMLALALGSLTMYGDVAFGHPTVKVGFVS